MKKSSKKKTNKKTIYSVVFAIMLAVSGLLLMYLVTVDENVKDFNDLFYILPTLLFLVGCIGFLVLNKKKK